jgi:hypothetical protein
MCKQLKILFALVVMLSLAGSARAYTYSWCVSSGNWADSARWDVMPSPTLVGEAFIYNGAIVDVTTAGQGAYHLAIGYPQDGATVNVAAGIDWTITYSLRVGIDYGPGNIGIGLLNVYGAANVGWLRMSTTATSVSTINVYNGGTLNVVGAVGYAASTNAGEAAFAAINLKGNGSMVIGGSGAGTLDLNGGRGRIDIEVGQLKVKGDYRTVLQGYVNNGWITSFGGRLRHCTPTVTYQDGWTYVKTTGGCICESYPAGDMNHDCYVDLSDFALLAESWLDCTNSDDPICSQVKLDMHDTILRISRYGQSLDISLNCPKFTFNSTSTAEGIAPVSIVGDISSGQVVTVSYNPIALNGLVSIEPQLLLQWSPEENIVRKWAHYRITGTPSNLVLQEIVLEKMAKSLLSVEPIINSSQSYPAFANGFFMGIEFPVASTRIDGQNLILGHKPGLRPQAGVWYESRKAVYGAATPSKERKAFEDYITLHRPQPTGLYISYNSWLSTPYPYTNENHILALMQTFKDNMTTPYGVSFDGFTIDYWSDSQSIWDINTLNFPGGLVNLQAYAQTMGTNLGVWSSPSGMYPGAIDTNWAYQNGYETWKWPWATMRLCCMAGPLYKTAYMNRLVSLANLGVSVFKFDGYELYCNSSAHGHEPNELSAEALAQGGIDVFQAIHAASPNAWLRATCFSWTKVGSPWWLFYLNSITGFFGDDAPIGKVPCPTYMESYTTARDYYNLQGASLAPVPINAQEVMGIYHTTTDPFLNDSVITVMRGHGLLPLYFNPAVSIMDSGRWYALAKLLIWARDNNETILANTYPLLPASWQNGNQPKFSSYDIMPREVYGYAHCKNNQALISLRNPWIMPQTYTLKVDESIGFNSQAAGLSAVSLYPENRVYGQNLQYGSTLTFPIAPYETVVLTIGSGYNLSGIATVGGSIGGKIQANVTYSNVGNGFTIDVNATVDSNAPQTKLLVCMEGTYQNPAALATPTYQLLVNGVPASVQVISSEDGWRATGISAWEHWKFLQVNLTSAHSVISLQQLQSDPNCTNVSIWTWGTKSGSGTPSFPNSLPCPEFINLDAALLGNFNR